MKFALFYHSLLSDWNHGNAHFLRGVASELISRGYHVDVYEPADGWSLKHLLAEQGVEALGEFKYAYPHLKSRLYSLDKLDIERALDGVDVVVVHEWNDPLLIERIGACAAKQNVVALFHDTHHRCITSPHEMAALKLDDYAGVLAFGESIAEQYRRHAWAQRVWVWHEAADTRHFRPLPCRARHGDLVWIGNWGDEERTRELREFLVEPAAELKLKTTVYGVRYPQHARDMLDSAQIHYGGWVANHKVPDVFSAFGCTMHVPRRAYAESLPGVPTIRMFEALACGIPLVSAPWRDEEHLFRPGNDYLVVRNGAEMRQALRDVANDRWLAQSLVEHGLETILARHTCRHRVDELLGLIAGFRTNAHSPAPSAAAGR